MPPLSLTTLLALLRRLAESPQNPPPAPGAECIPEQASKTEPAQPRLADPEAASNSVPSAAPTPPRAIGAAGLALIKRFEGCAARRPDGMVQAYPDPGTGGDPWTIGWGATGRDHVHGGRIKAGTCWTQTQCDERLASDLVRYAADVSRAIKDAPTNQAQFDAMVSFHYNTGAIGRATLTRKHIAGDYGGAAQEFARWNKAGGRVMKGLVRRRAAEAALYRGDQ